MLQEEMTLQQVLRQPVPIQPTFVLCLGRFGEEVGKQLVARLMLTEESLKRDGLASSLLVQSQGEHETAGFVRVMHVDWEQWFSENYDPDVFLRDITVPDLGSAEDGTRPWQCEEDRPPNDWDEARLALKRLRMRTLLTSVSTTLCTHDTPMRLGSYQTHDRSTPLGMRLIVVCAAREAASAEIGPDLIELLGDVYITRNALVKGLQVICYMGHTEFNEHRLAGGDEREFDNLLEQELARIVPENRRSSTQSSNRSFVERINELWMDKPQIVESCYLLDSQLINNIIPVRQRPNEPDETVVAAALAINLFVASDADRKVRQQIQQRNASGTQLGECGPFATLGISAYALDHPRLRQLIYARLAGIFLRQVHPEQQGDDPEKELELLSRNKERKERLEDEALEEQIVRDVDRLCQQYRRGITFAYAQSVQPPLVQFVHGKLNYRQAIAGLRASRTVDDEVRYIVQELLEDVKKRSLVELIRERQLIYVELLDETFRDVTAPLYEEERATVTRLYRFAQQSLTVLRGEVTREEAPPVQIDLIEAREAFAQRQQEDFEKGLKKRIDVIQDIMAAQPNQINILMRVLLFAVVFSLFGFMVSQVQQVQAWFNALPFLASFTFTPPIWAVMLCVAVLLWSLLTIYYRWRCNRQLRYHLSRLVQEHKKILEEADHEAWRFALTKQFEQQELEATRIAELCGPGGMLTKLREQFLQQKFVARDSILEHIFFDERVQAEMENVVQRLAAYNKLWIQRKHLLRELLNADWTDSQNLERWLQKKAGEAYKGDSAMIVDLVGNFLRDQTVQRLSEVWQEMVNAAALFIRGVSSGQHDLIINLEIFSMHNIEDFPELEMLVQSTRTEILSNVDRLRWIFTHIKAGLSLEQLSLNAERIA